MGQAGRAAGAPVRGASVVVLAARLKQRATAAILDARARRMARRELELLADLGQLNQVMAECGLSQSDLAFLKRPAPGWAGRLHGMRARLGLEELAEACDLPLIGDLDRVCRRCSAAKACEKWLRAGASDGVPAFCPNQPNFEVLRCGAGR